MALLPVQNAEIYYEIHGEGPPLLLLHGLTANSTMFHYDIEYLKESFQVIVMDARGHGKSSKPENYTLSDHIQDVIALLTELDIKKVSIMGNSMGTYIAQGVAIEEPELVDKLVLVSSKSSGETSSSERLFREHAEELKGLSEEEQQQILFKYSFKNQEAVEKFMQEDGVSMGNVSKEEQLAANRALHGFNFNEDLHKIKAHTLVINGLYDGLNPPQEGEFISNQIPKSSFILFEESGHSPNLEEPQRFKKTLLSFLKS